MKKLITLLLVFMLTSTVNMFASFVEDHVGNPIEYTFDPPEGVYSADELQSITLKFPNATTIGGSKQGNTEILVKRKYPNGKTDDSAYWYTPNGNKLEITGLIPASGAFESGTFEYGTWEIFIWGFNIYVDGQYLDNDVVVKYTIAPPDFSLESAVPANSETVNSLENILIDFDADSVLTGSAEVVVNGAKDVIATLTPTANAGQVQVVLSQAITAEGNYSLTIPAKTFKLADGSGNQEVTLNYSVKFPAWNATEILANPVDRTKKTNFNVITLTFPEDIEIVGTEALTLGNIPVTAAKTGAREVSITPTAPVADWAVGEYKLTIPADYFKGTSKRSPKLSYSWEIVSSLLTIESFEIYKEYTKEVTLDLTNGVAYSGFQADITLPEGLTVVDNKFTLNRGVEGNHVLQSNVLRSSGKTRLLCYPSKKVNGSMPDLTGNSGEALVTFTVEASTDFVGGDITVDGIVFSTADGESSKLQDASAKVEAREYATEITFTNAPEAAFELGEVTPEGQEFTAAVNAGAYNKDIEWKVEQTESVITFENGIIRAVGVGQATITATALGAAPGETVAKSCTVEVVYTHATEITIATQDGSETVAIEALDEFQLTATPTPATNKTIVWESSNPDVVTVDETGKLTGVTVGEAVITAMIKDAEGNVYVSKTIDVKVDSTVATSVVIMTTDETPAVAPESADLHVTGTATYKAKVDDLATNKAVAWESSNSEIAEVVYDAETGIATVTAKAVGTAVITVKALGADPEREPVVDTITINVLETNAADIEITGEVAAQYESADDGDAATFKLTAVVAPDYTTYKNVAWVSSNPNAATVDQEGNVTIGSATDEEVTITAIAINNEVYDADKDYSGYVQATVKFAVVHTFATSVAIQEAQESIPTLQAADDSKNTFQLTAVAAPTTNKDIVWEVVVNDENEEPVVSVDQTGLVTALRTGEATVVARIEGTAIIDSRVITVVATPGDVNDNGTLDVFDINLLAAYILEADNLPENFVAAAADYNGDGLVNVADIIRLSNIVLTEEDTPVEANARMYRTRQYADSSNSLFIEDFTIAEGETKQIAIMLNNNAAFSAFQADIYLPEGLEIVEATLSDRKADHTLASAMRNNGSVRLLSYSMGLNSYAGSEGELVYLTVKATDNFVGDFQIEIDNIKFATVDFAEYYLEPTVANVAGYTGVEDVENDEIVVKVVGNSIVAPEGAEVYDLNGLRVNAENLAKGIYIVKVGNQVVKVII